MKKIILSCVFCLLAGVIAVSAQTDYCFENNGLKVRQIVSFTVTKNKIEGTFESGGYDADTSMEMFDFTGVKTGNLLTIKFISGKPPYEVARGTTKIVWTLVKSALKIPIYGKNYTTGKYSTYAASFDKCRNDQ